MESEFNQEANALISVMEKRARRWKGKKPIELPLDELLPQVDLLQALLRRKHEMISCTTIILTELRADAEKLQNEVFKLQQHFMKAVLVPPRKSGAQKQKELIDIKSKTRRMTQEQIDEWILDLEGKIEAEGKCTVSNSTKSVTNQSPEQ